MSDRGPEHEDELEEEDKMDTRLASPYIPDSPSMEEGGASLLL